MSVETAKAEAVEAVVTAAGPYNTGAYEGPKQKTVREAALRLWDAAQAAMPCYLNVGRCSFCENDGGTCLDAKNDAWRFSAESPLCPSCTAGLKLYAQAIADRLPEIVADARASFHKFET